MATLKPLCDEDTEELVRFVLDELEKADLDELERNEAQDIEIVRKSAPTTGLSSEQIVISGDHHIGSGSHPESCEDYRALDGARATAETAANRGGWVRSERRRGQGVGASRRDTRQGLGLL